MSREAPLDDLWKSVPPSTGVFDPDGLARLPAPARRYLAHAIVPGTPLASAVRLRMHGEIKLKGWLPFTAEQVISWHQGMIWKATVRMHGLPVSGFDRYLDGEGAMRWKLLGLVPVMTASGPDVSRSAAGRVEAESCWLPSVLCGEDVSWTAADPSHPHARLTLRGEATEVEFSVDESGRCGRSGCRDGEIRKERISTSPISAGSSRRSGRSEATRSPPNCGSDGISARTASNPKGNSSG